ncbi:hypothetical protein [Pseudomonas xanthosomatis]|uniref:hypothetical protein n=1 Tax=Pseudomonas xanthosomatis TaxID=2842356 RepID=UPI00351606C2
MKDGELDTEYGINGYATVPPQHIIPGRSLRTTAAVLMPDDSVVAYGTNPEDPEQFFFTRINADGSPDLTKGHVKVKRTADASPLDTYHVQNIYRAAESSFITFAPCVTYSVEYEGQDAKFTTVAIGRYGVDFAPWPGFGDNGIVKMTHAMDGMTGTSSLTQSPFPTLTHQPGPPQKQVSKYGDSSQLINGLIRAVYSTEVLLRLGSEKLWLSLLDPDTGAPVPGLGQDGDACHLELEQYQGQTMMPRCVRFLEDGGFYLTATTGHSHVLAKFLANGLLDPTFASNGVKKLDYVNLVFPMAIIDNKFWIASTYLNEVTLLCLDKNGNHDPNFNSGRPLGIPCDVYNMMEPQAITLDAQGRVLITGQRGAFLSRSLQPVAYRVLVEGKLDETFGVNGMFTADASLTFLKATFFATDYTLLLNIQKFNLGDDTEGSVLIRITS